MAGSLDMTGMFIYIQPEMGGEALMEEIMETVRMICKQIIENKRSPLVDGMRFDKFFQKEFNKVKESYVN